MTETDDNKKKKEDVKEQIKKDIGFIPAPQAKDPYRSNILWILRTLDRDFDENGKIFFKAKILMEKFGASDDGSLRSFVQKQQTKIEIINRKKEYEYIVSCGTSGIDGDGDTLFFYQRGFKRELESFEQQFPLSGENIKIGNSEIDPSTLDGVEISKLESEVQ